MQRRAPGTEPSSGGGHDGEAARVDLHALLPDFGLSAECSRPLRHLTIDSREVVPDSVFIAVPGEKTDGHAYVPEALRNGAAVVFHQDDRRLDIDRSAYPKVTFIPTPDTRRLGRRLAPVFYGFPSRAMQVVAITGTNGKTTCSCLLEAMYRGLGRRTGLMNTLGIRYPGASLTLANAVPEPVRLQRLLYDMAAAGVDRLVLEVSSQALADGRLQGVDLDSAILTNVTPDHLDAHGTMEEYLKAKLLLFDTLAGSSKRRRTASLWRDCWGFPKIVERACRTSAEVCVHFIGPEDDRGAGGVASSLGAGATGAPELGAAAQLGAAADLRGAAGLGSLRGDTRHSSLRADTWRTSLRADSLVLEPAQTSFVLHREGANSRRGPSIHPQGAGARQRPGLREGAGILCRTSLLGRFNVLNILAALGSDRDFLDAVCAGDPHHKQVLDTALDEVVVPGRLQLLPNSLGARVFVDYAHTEDGLEHVLGLLHSLPHRSLYTVFGCGGDRDPSKRPRMGAVAGRYSDLVFLTNDNPRTEDPAAIIAAIAGGFGENRNYIVIQDREEAIAGAIGLLTEGDILLIAGKGHESSQVIGADALPFSDVEVAQRHLSRRG